MTESPDERLASFLDDLEQQAAGAWQVERGLEVHERARAEYARVTLAGRLMASIGAELELGLVGVGPVAGRLVRSAERWCLLETRHVTSIVRLAALVTVRGASARSVAAESWPATARLGLGSALRGLAGETCVVGCVDGARVEGLVGRVGADFVEVQPRQGQPSLVAFDAIAVVSR